jgi:hypothetical protein
MMLKATKSVVVAYRLVVRLPFRQLRAQWQLGSGTVQRLGLDTSKA